jgi:type II secretory pathway component GspD/PulD (secretin)
LLAGGFLVRTIKLVTISAIAIGFIVWLSPNQLIPIAEQTKEESGAANSQVFIPQHSDSESGSVVQDQIVNNAAQSPSPPPLYILFTSNQLSLEASSHPLKAIVDKIVQQSGITIVLSEAMANQPTTIQFHDLSIEQGLYRLFEHYDIFFFYTQDHGKSARLATVWVYPQGQGKQFSPISARANEMIQDTTDTDPVKRASAIANLIEQQGSGATEIAHNALTDPDERIRIHTLNAALRAQVNLSLDTLKDLAQHDASAKVRSIALAGLFNRSEEGLIKSSDILDTLITAQKDNDPEVSELAAQLMQSLEEASTEAGEQAPQEFQEQSMYPQFERIPGDAK